VATRDRAARSSELVLEAGSLDRNEQDRLIGAAVENLLASGALTPDKLARATAINQKTHERLDALLIKLGLVHEEHLAQALAEACGLPLVRQANFPVVPACRDTLSTEYLRAQRAAPIMDGEASILLVLADPFSRDVATAVAFKTGFIVNIAVGVAGEIDAWLAAAAHEKPESRQPGAAATDAGYSDLERLRDLAGGAPVIRWVDQLFEQAVAAGASDIHLEPGERVMRTRLRIDGVLRDIAPPDPGISEAAISRIKILAKLNIAERRLPQDGRTHIAAQGREIDLRVATSPTLHGEGAVLRLLDRSVSLRTLDSLGLSPDAVDRLRQSVRRPNGVTLVTGPTGSGKTTTLYAALRDILSPELKLVSVEDPIEYQIDGVSQIQVKPSIELTFARALRSVLRQDPDVLMIGEIRDRETATIAIEAALTGHQVLSTLHTNNAPATITRLLEMGVPEYLIGSTLSAVSAQRLVRNLCPACSEPWKPPASLLDRLAGLGGIEDATFRRPKGCPACRGTGYRGRSSICEIMVVSDRIRDMILIRASESSLRAAAIEEGMTPLLADGVRRAAAGLTSIEDVIRVAGLD
jgi:general secretion pathway protein E